MFADDSIRSIKGIGEKTALGFLKLGITTVSDLLMYFPRAYDTYRQPIPIGELTDGCISTIECMISSYPKKIKAGRYDIVSTVVSDATGSIRLTWFNQPYIVKLLKPGSRFYFRGRISSKRDGLTMVQPEVLTAQNYYRKSKELQPVYPLTAGISNNTISKAVKQSSEYLCSLDDYLTSSQRTGLGLMSLKDAVSEIHFPVNEDSLKAARKRLVFDEFFTFMALGRIIKAKSLKTVNTHRVCDFSAMDSFTDNLGYELTGAQKRVLTDIRNDLSAEYVSSRLLQGDVGCGKTIVAAAAIYASVSAGYQGCIMAPTDVLATQHYEELCRLFDCKGIKTVLLTGKLSAAQKREAYNAIREHKADIIVGTHAIIQEGVEFADLGIAVVDEQHRFGVRQREMISSKGHDPYVLVMSATPIPRSLAIILYGEMNLSVIDELPKNRLPIKNCVVDRGYRPTAYNFIRKRVSEGEQVYVICPMIEESEELDAENVRDYSERLKEELPGINIDFLHGKMKNDEKQKVLDSFYSGHTDILVSTTVVEVGVNVPNATVMLVENTERFGLAQLHQLRGRVGRGDKQSYCIFMKGNSSRETDERLDILTRFNDGMKVAEEDLKQRGPGDFFGVRQSGELDLKLADIIGDADILQTVTAFLNSISDEKIREMADRVPFIFKGVNQGELVI